MKIIKQGSWMNTIRRAGEGQFETTATFLSSDFEGSINLLCRSSDFEILDAKWAIFRAKDKERRGEGTAHMLIGESAFVNDKRNSVKILPDYSRCVDYLVPPGGWMGQEFHKSEILDQPPEEVSPEWENIRELYLEAMRGALQGENFLMEERGIKDLEQYERDWLATSPACRPYNLRMPEVHEWPEYIGSTHEYRLYDMYNKYLQATFWDNEDGTATGVGGYHDSFHEMNAKITYRLSDGVITDIDVTMVRVPFETCWDINGSFAESLVGMSVNEISKRDVGKVLGGRLGCFHMVDAVIDMINLVKEK